MATLDRRVRDLERADRECSGPLVVFGEPTPEQRRVIEEAKRVGRQVIRWPIPPAPIAREGSARSSTRADRAAKEQRP